MSKAKGITKFIVGTDTDPDASQVEGLVVHNPSNLDATIRLSNNSVVGFIKTNGLLGMDFGYPDIGGTLSWRMDPVGNLIPLQTNVNLGEPTNHLTRMYVREIIRTEPGNPLQISSADAIQLKIDSGTLAWYLESGTGRLMPNGTREIGTIALPVNKVVALYQQARSSVFVGDDVGANDWHIVKEPDRLALYTGVFGAGSFRWAFNTSGSFVGSGTIGEFTSRISIGYFTTLDAGTGNFTNVTATGTFNGGNFSGNTFSGTQFNGGNFSGNTFSGTQFNGGDFAGNVMTANAFSGGTFNGSTCNVNEYYVNGVQINNVSREFFNLTKLTVDNLVIDGSQVERVSQARIFWDNDLEIDAASSINFLVGGFSAWSISGTTTRHLLPASPNVHDLGSPTQYVRSAYIGTVNTNDVNILSGTQLGFVNDSWYIDTSQSSDFFSSGKSIRNLYGVFGNGSRLILGHTNANASWILESNNTFTSTQGGDLNMNGGKIYGPSSVEVGNVVIRDDGTWNTITTNSSESGLRFGVSDGVTYNGDTINFDVPLGTGIFSIDANGLNAVGNKNINLNSGTYFGAVGQFGSLQCSSNTVFQNGGSLSVGTSTGSLILASGSDIQLTTLGIYPITINSSTWNMDASNFFLKAGAGEFVGLHGGEGAVRALNYSGLTSDGSVTLRAGTGSEGSTAPNRSFVHCNGITSTALGGPGDLVLHAQGGTSSPTSNGLYLTAEGQTYLSVVKGLNGFHEFQTLFSNANYNFPAYVFKVGTKQVFSISRTSQETGNEDVRATFNGLVRGSFPADNTTDVPFFIQTLHNQSGAQQNLDYFAIWAANHDLSGNTKLLALTGTGDLEVKGSLSLDNLQVNIPFTGCHVYASDVALESGDAVYLDSDNKLQKTSIPQDKRIIGVVEGVAERLEENFVDSKNNSWNKISDSVEVYTVAAVGDSRTTIMSGAKVCDEGGIVENGDYLCSSSKPGFLMKQPDDIQHNYTVAKAGEDVVFDANGEATGVYILFK